MHLMADTEAEDSAKHRSDAAAETEDPALDIAIYLRMISTTV